MTETEIIENLYPDYVKQLPDGHPVRNYFLENFYLEEILSELGETDPVEKFQEFFNLFNQLCEVEKRYARKENQLFPFLEKRGWNGPSQGMWSFHDANRDLLRAIRKRIEERKIAEIKVELPYVIDEFRRMMKVEEMRLFPISLQILTEDDWKEMSVGEKEIGFMIPIESTDSVEELPPVTSAAVDNGRLKMEEGLMTLEQINLLLKFMPVDLTYVDENDRVIFYNRGEERVFPRSAGIIGREVRFCHPPKSVGTVLRILEEFRNGNKDEAEFWIRFKGRVIHIRYFAIRDAQRNYKGVIEMSQDITEIQKLEGECRLLNWDESNQES